MKTSPLLSLLLLVTGAALLVWGMSSTHTLAPALLEGVPTYRSILVVIVGACLATLGIVLRQQRTT